MATNTLFMGGGGVQQANADFRSLFDYFDICFSPRGGVVDPFDPTLLHMIHQVCSVAEWSNVASAPQNETTVVEAGKDRLTTS